MRSFRQIVLETGVTGGLLFTIHVCIPNCGSWPMIWPALAGITTVWLATGAGRPHRWRTGVAAALATGFFAAAIALVGVAAVVYFVTHTGIAAALQQARAASPALASVTGADTLAITAWLAAMVFVVAFLGGMLVLPARYFQTRHAPA